jgi:hypothetical protein
MERRPNIYVVNGKRIKGRYIYHKPEKSHGKFWAMMAISTPYKTTRLRTFFTYEEAKDWLEAQPCG